ncbi:PhoH family protein [Anaerotignum lactatifermentans]|uniref:PhoH-like protein n=1 Tax=Anaerotignum lactatifermentans TaxID=160404 RepID=A0ABS2GB55_9FIRM|nr:PhoH family protein [Anaerotignum lactatifermentans]MBM6829519.1 PhoH family protein [Anaerotignum lactatifermentans]MBM6878013.1 PhoH family protein [Anaerotignum lactatifermentans]MBM6951157.1 PhoH family protein [Anaerotignum lactatifermentans]
MSRVEKTLQLENEIILPVFGQFDSNIRKIEKECAVQIVNRGDDVKVTGEERDVQAACNVLQSLAALVRRGEEITEQNLEYFISSAAESDLRELEKVYDDLICVTANGRPLKPKTLGQKKYTDLIRQNTIVFGIGPAGTGKTYLAMAMAITAFKNNEVNRIILTRPAIEAGEKLGFLPGDLQQKVDPYLRPLYDALYEIMGAETFLKNMEKGLIEVAPLAYMRGRTLDNAFIVLDEAQNTTPEQMKMFLTRIGYGSKAVITGDITQIDLTEGKRSGLLEATKILSGIEGIGLITLTNKDVVRHPLVQKIILAYEKFENRKRSESDGKKEKRFR